MLEGASYDWDAARDRAWDEQLPAWYVSQRRRSPELAPPRILVADLHAAVHAAVRRGPSRSARPQPRRTSASSGSRGDPSPAESEPPLAEGAA